MTAVKTAFLVAAGLAATAAAAPNSINIVECADPTCSVNCESTPIAVDKCSFIGERTSFGNHVEFTVDRTPQFSTTMVTYNGTTCADPTGIQTNLCGQFLKDAKGTYSYFGRCDTAANTQQVTYHYGCGKAGQGCTGAFQMPQYACRVPSFDSDHQAVQLLSVGQVSSASVRVAYYNDRMCAAGAAAPIISYVVPCGVCNIRNGTRSSQYQC